MVRMRPLRTRCHGAPNDGHMHHAVYKFIDKDHFQTIWTFRKDQKDACTEDMTFARTH